MADKTARKPYVKPLVQKRGRLTDVAEGGNLLVSGPNLKGGCFSNKR